jgi:hypothetical protein
MAFVIAGSNLCAPTSQNVDYGVQRMGQKAHIRVPATREHCGQSVTQPAAGRRAQARKHMATTTCYQLITQEHRQVISFPRPVRLLKCASCLHIMVPNNLDIRKEFVRTCQGQSGAPVQPVHHHPPSQVQPGCGGVLQEMINKHQGQQW